MIYTIPCGEDCFCAWGPEQPATLNLTTSGFTDGPCNNDPGINAYRCEIASGINGTFAALTITPHTDGWTADFGTIGQMDVVFHDPDVNCTTGYLLDSSSIITVKLVFTISTGNYVITWSAYNPGAFTMATASGTYPASMPTVVNDSIYPANDPFNWGTGTVLISL